MINNRQGNRRRGRGGQQRPQGLSGNAGGNRQDNRSRGNAAQLLEKYKAMARDAQLGGDRVQAEYYLQFADHYFRVLGESRSRFDEQRRDRGEEEDENFGDESLEMEADESTDFQRQDRGERPDRGYDRGDGADDGQGRRERFSRDDREERRDRAPRANGRPRPQANPEDGAERIALDTLPPAIGVAAEDGADGAVAPLDSQEPPAPRRRTRRPRVAEGEGDIAPAA